MPQSRTTATTTATMRATILKANGSEGGTVDLADTLFGAPINESLIHQAVIRQLAGRRTGTADTQTRGEVTGGGKKPWRQKGTGRARQGSKSAPHWTGGGVVFGPHPRSYEQKMPSKMRRSALRGVLTAKRADGALRVVEAVELDEGRTKTMLERLTGWKAEGKVLLVLPSRDPAVERSCRNLQEVRVILADSLNVVDLLEADTVVFTQAALDRAQEVYA
jgi:large subunit ribosomal protein L4